MSFDKVMQQAGDMVQQAQAVAALAAHLRLRQLEVDGDEAVNAHLARVLDSMGTRDLCEALTAEQAAMIAGYVRSYLRQAVDLVEDPGREGAWTNDDPATLQAQGQASTVVAQLFVGAGLGRDGVRILDIGTGVGRLAIAFCRTFGGATVVGLDPFEPALALARQNVADEELDDRITLVPRPIQDFDDDDGFDLVWFPTFFVPEAVIDDALGRLRTMARPGAEVVLGVFEAPEDPFAAAVDALFTVRAGGAVLTIDEAASRLERAEFERVERAVPGANVPLQLVVGRT
jgi:ubiquinone/menaquinone biosynthesis C-methylase UbiE